MSNDFRIDGGMVDRNQPLTFKFNNKTLHGFHGDTLASALLANGERLVGRSFKYHRPRGIFSAGSEEPNALVQLRSGAYQEPNTRATTAELFDGLTATSQNHRGPLGFDVMSVTDLLSPLHRRWLLLQNLHVARRILGKNLRTRHPRICGTGCIIDARRPR